MIIDFHTHIFPEKIADKTVALLAQNGHTQPYSDGKPSGLIERLSEAGADIAVALPVLTSPSQFDSVNRYAAEINKAFVQSSPRIISFAGIHPRCEDIEDKMASIKQCGFLGVKIHPDYQDTFIDDEGYVKILRSAREHDLIVVTHAGVDGAFRDREVKCTPERVLNLLSDVTYGKLVLAHLGANEMTDEVIDKLCGANVYFDTAYVLKYTTEETFKKIISRHGADKILFATDSPWSNIKDDVEIIKSFSLDKITEQSILCDNARTLLGI